MKYKKIKKGDLWNKKNPNILELESDIKYEYNSIHINEGCTLTVKPWKGRNNYIRERNEHLNKLHSIDQYKLDIITSYWNNHNIIHSYDIQELILSYMSSHYSSFGGGRLFLKCKTNLIIEKGAKIEVNSCGYTSGIQNIFHFTYFIIIILL